MTAKRMECGVFRRFPVVFVFVAKAALPCRRGAECLWDFSHFAMKSECRVLCVERVSCQALANAA